MKYFGLALMMGVVVAAPVFAEDLVNQEEFQAAASAAGDMSFNISLAQAARLLDYCGQKDKAKEVRDYLQPVTMAVAKEKFKDGTQSERGMFLSRNIGASMSSEIATMALLEKLEPLSEAQKAKVCGFASESYGKIIDMQARNKAKSGALIPAAAQ